MSCRHSAPIYTSTDIDALPTLFSMLILLEAISGQLWPLGMRHGRMSTPQPLEMHTRSKE